MKVLVVLSVLVVFAAAALTPEEMSVLEAFDFDALYANKELSQAVLNCLLEKGDCGAYKQMTDLAMKALQSECAECTPELKTKYAAVMKRMKVEYEPYYNELMEKIAATKKN